MRRRPMSVWEHVELALLLVLGGFGTVAIALIIWYVPYLLEGCLIALAVTLFGAAVGAIRNWRRRRKVGRR